MLKKNGFPQDSGLACVTQVFSLSLFCCDVAFVPPKGSCWGRLKIIQPSTENQRRGACDIEADVCELCFQTATWWLD